jgi:predicted DNA binding CopG/RHH family protein
LNGQIDYHYPRPWFEHVKDYSLFLNFVLERCHQALVNLKWIAPKPTEEIITADRRVAVRMTEIALTRLKKAVESKGAILIIYILGNLSGSKSEMDDVVAIDKKLNIPMITGGWK